MPVSRSCPGAPICTRTFLYTTALKAHADQCQHAMERQVKSNEEAKRNVKLISDVGDIVENQQRGNITICRHKTKIYRPKCSIYKRDWPETNGYCVPRLTNDL